MASPGVEGGPKDADEGTRTVRHTVLLLDLSTLSTFSEGAKAAETRN